MHHHPRNRERAINLSILSVSGPDFGFPEAARRVMGITPPHRQSASFMVGTTTEGARARARRRGEERPRGHLPRAAAGQGGGHTLSADPGIAARGGRPRAATASAERRRHREHGTAPDPSRGRRGGEPRWRHATTRRAAAAAAAAGTEGDRGRTPEASHGGGSGTPGRRDEHGGDVPGGERTTGEAPADGTRTAASKRTAGPTAREGGPATPDAPARARAATRGRTHRPAPPTGLRATSSRPAPPRGTRSHTSVYQPGAHTPPGALPAEAARPVPDRHPQRRPGPGAERRAARGEGAGGPGGPHFPPGDTRADTRPDAGPALAGSSPDSEGGGAGRGRTRAALGPTAGPADPSPRAGGGDALPNMQTPADRLGGLRAERGSDWGVRYPKAPSRIAREGLLTEGRPPPPSAPTGLHHKVLGDTCRGEGGLLHQQRAGTSLPTSWTPSGQGTGAHCLTPKGSAVCLPRPHVFASRPSPTHGLSLTANGGSPAQGEHNTTASIAWDTQHHKGRLGKASVTTRDHGTLKETGPARRARTGAPKQSPGRSPLAVSDGTGKDRGPAVRDSQAASRSTLGPRAGLATGRTGSRPAAGLQVALPPPALSTHIPDRSPPPQQDLEKLSGVGAHPPTGTHPGQQPGPKRPPRASPRRQGPAPASGAAGLGKILGRESHPPADRGGTGGRRPSAEPPIAATRGGPRRVEAAVAKTSVCWSTHTGSQPRLGPPARGQPRATRLQLWRFNLPPAAATTAPSGDAGPSCQRCRPPGTVTRSQRPGPLPCRLRRSSGDNGIKAATRRRPTTGLGWQRDGWRSPAAKGAPPAGRPGKAIRRPNELLEPYSPIGKKNIQRSNPIYPRTGRSVETCRDVSRRHPIHPKRTTGSVRYRRTVVRPSPRAIVIA
nr:collagen alpha-1(III) chain-like [Dasypus novemcinctus]XP_058148810.1 collagen alpha-1(III) chain-like [Dasypus novemcinctus]XP_058148812.1 collagen alpha-1(III) chain-like [Dasypus novemcinctus]XP_058148821.1 collagen alpha-1(III) chain-like [Dasypus novemcinctus]XP_058148832.1 collagen alpha-1(III) chain-like [Dasypus novemcinctus]